MKALRTLRELLVLHGGAGPPEDQVRAKIRLARAHRRAAADRATAA